MKSIYRRFMMWLMGTRFYSGFVLKVLPFIRFSLYYTKIRGNQFNKGRLLLEDGDMILTIDKKKASTFIIPGVWSHVGLFLGDSTTHGYEVAEMTHHGYTHSFFFDLCKEADRLMIVRCKDFDAEYIRTVVAECKKYDGTDYDTQFKLGVKALYCSELIYLSDIEKRLQVSLRDLAGLNRPYLSPDGLAKAKNLEIIWDSDDEKPKY